MERRSSLGTDTDLRISDFMNIESTAIKAINAEENEEMKALVTKAMEKYVS